MTRYAKLTQTGTPTTALNASFATNVMTVNSLTGSLVNSPNLTAVGTFIYGASVPANTYITAQLTGSVGGTGTYSLSTTPGTIGSEACTTQFGWQVPAGVTNLNLIECEGSGYGGEGSVNAGGGGGAYSNVANFGVTPLSWIPYHVAATSIGTISSAPTSGGHTWFNGTALASATVSAASSGGTGGGLALNSIGTTKFDGGSSGGSAQGGGGGGGPLGHGGSSNGSSSGGGGGNGGGSNGGVNSGGFYGSGGNNHGGTGGGAGVLGGNPGNSGTNGGGGGGGDPGGSGGNGTDFADGATGSGGGGGTTGSNGHVSGNGGLYGGGGGPAQNTTAGGNGAQGVILISMPNAATSFSFGGVM